MSEIDNEIDREKLIEKALKLKALADRGVGGEMSNAIRMFENYKLKHGITDDELEDASSDKNSWYDKIPREERKSKFAQWFKRSVTFDGRKMKPIVFFHKSRTVEQFTEFDYSKGTKYTDVDNYGFHFIH